MKLHRKHYPRRRRHRRNPSFGGVASGAISSVKTAFKDYGVGAIAAAAVDTFVMDPLLNGGLTSAMSLDPMYQGPVKAVLYPVAATLLAKFAPSFRKHLVAMGVVGFGFGVKETFQSLVGAPQFKVKELGALMQERKLGALQPGSIGLDGFSVAEDMGQVVE